MYGVCAQGHEAVVVGPTALQYSTWDDAHELAYTLTRAGVYDVAVEMLEPRWYQETSYLVTRRPVRCASPLVPRPPPSRAAFAFRLQTFAPPSSATTLSRMTGGSIGICRLTVTPAAADPTRTVVVPPVRAAAGAPASLVLTLADSFGNVVVEDLTAALHVSLSGPASLASPDVCPAPLRASPLDFPPELWKSVLEHCAAASNRLNTPLRALTALYIFDTHAGGECGVATQRHVRRSFQSHSGRHVQRARVHPQRG